VGGPGDAPRIISGLYPGGSTFLSGGLEEGFRQAKSGKRRGTLNRVLLLSDGLATWGGSSRRPAGARGDMAECGVSVSTFGVGNSFDEELMTMIAGAAGGSTATSAIPSGSWRRWNPSSHRLADGRVRDRDHHPPEEGVPLRLSPGRDWRRDGDAYVIRLGDLSAANVGPSRQSERGREGAGLREVGDVALRYRDPATSKVVTASAKSVSLELVRDERSIARGSTGRCRRRRPSRRRTCWCRKRPGWPTREEGGGEGDARQGGGRAGGRSPSPAVRAEMDHANRYKDSLDTMAT